MNGEGVEAFLARLYTDSAALDRFLDDPRGEAQRAGLDPEACAALVAVDRSGIELAAASFKHKRERKHQHARRGIGGLLAALIERLRR